MVLLTPKIIHEKRKEIITNRLILEYGMEGDNESELSDEDSGTNKIHKVDEEKLVHQAESSYQNTKSMTTECLSPVMLHGQGRSTRRRRVRTWVWGTWITTPSLGSRAVRLAHFTSNFSPS